MKVKAIYENNISLSIANRTHRASP